MSTADEKAPWDIHRSQNSSAPPSPTTPVSQDPDDRTERHSTPDVDIDHPHNEPPPAQDKDADPEKASPLRRTASNVLAHVASRITTRSLPEPPPPPNGGTKAWTQVAMGWLVIFTTWGYVNSFGSFQTYYENDMLRTIPASTISWIGSVQVFLTFFVGAFSGRLLDAGLFLPTFVVGASLQIVGVFLTSVSTRYWQLMLTQGVLTGLGGGIYFTPSLALVNTYFSTRRGLAVGVTTTGNAMGGMIYPIVTRELLPKLGFAWTVRVLGFINLGFLIVVALLMRPRLPPRKSGPVIDWSAFQEPVYVAFVSGLFFLVWANYYSFYYIASFGTDFLGMPYSQSSILIILINAVGVIARMIPPVFADRYGPLNVMVPITLGLFIILYCWLSVNTVVGLFVFTCVLGAFSGGFQCLMPTAVASITKRLDKVGTRMGMMFSIVSFAALTGPPIGGALQRAAGGSFTGATVWAATSTLLCFVLLVVARVQKAGWKVGAWC